MEDVRKIVQRALDAVFFGAVEVLPETVEREMMPDEYITHSVVSGGYTDYANGRPIRRRDYVDVTWCGISIADKGPRAEQIIAAMVAANFDVINTGTDLTRTDASDYYGVTMEFALSRMVTQSGA